MRKLNSAVLQLTGQDLPVNCSPLRFASWMGGDRDGNPNVTAQARAHPANCLPATWKMSGSWLEPVSSLVSLRFSNAVSCGFFKVRATLIAEPEQVHACQAGPFSKACTGALDGNVCLFCLAAQESGMAGVRPMDRPCMPPWPCMYAVHRPLQ